MYIVQSWNYEKKLSAMSSIINQISLPHSNFSIWYCFKQWWNLLPRQQFSFTWWQP